MRILLLLLALMISACADRDGDGTLNFKKFNTSGEADDEEGGLSSSGGGEYILDRYNPWFMDKSNAKEWEDKTHKKTTVKYCINHNPKYFSLSKEEATQKIQEVIKNFAHQLESFQDIRNTSLELNPDFGAVFIDDLYDDPVMARGRLLLNDHLEWACHVGACPLLVRETPDYTNYGGYFADLLTSDLEGIKLYKAQIATQYELIKDCEQAEMEINLGNVDSKNIQRLRKKIGYVQFRHMAGVAIKTKYDYTTMRSKGFIYIAADKGKYAYAGPRNAAMGGEGDIWNFSSKFPPNTKVFEPSQFQYYKGAEIDFNLHKHFQGPFKSVFAHEFAHTLGTTHSVTLNEGPVNLEDSLMDINTPANLISTGLISNAKANYYMNLFNRSLMPLYRQPMRLNFARMTDNETGSISSHHEYKKELEHLANISEPVDDLGVAAYMDIAELEDLAFEESGVRLNYGKYLKKKYPVIFKAFFQANMQHGESYINNQFFSFEMSDNLEVKDHKLNLIISKTKDDGSLEPVVLKSYDVFMDASCQYPRVRNKIKFKSLFTNKDFEYKIVIDPETGRARKEPIESKNRFAVPYEETLFSFKDSNLCGEVMIDDTNAIYFILSITHDGLSRIRFIDPETNIDYIEDVKTLDFQVNQPLLKLDYIDFL
jgi:hypothetical protein